MPGSSRRRSAQALETISKRCENDSLSLRERVRVRGIAGRYRHFASPHPGPLPEGEGAFEIVSGEVMTCAHRRAVAPGETMPWDGGGTSVAAMRGRPYCSVKSNLFSLLDLTVAVRPEVFALAYLAGNRFFGAAGCCPFLVISGGT